LDNNIAAACQMLDEIMTLDLSLRGAIKKLYNAAYEKEKKPLTLAAAEKLIEAVKPGDVVFFLTGLLVRSAFTPDIGESDGPAGIAVLVNTMQKALGITPVLVADDSLVEPLSKVLSSGGFSRIPMQNLIEAAAPSKRPTRAFGVVTMPSDPAEAEKAAKGLLEQYKPAAIISCERGGPNIHGIFHNAQGKDISNYHCRADILFKLGYEKNGNPVTIGIGDGGNEVGMGSIADNLRSWLPYGDKCQCPCGGGVIPETKCDVLIASTVSNWGASALAAAIALLTGRNDALSTSDYHKRIIQASARAGFIDSPTGEVYERIDGMEMPVHLAISEAMCQVVNTVLSGSDKLWSKK
jgi:hypothetical protein